MTVDPVSQVLGCMSRDLLRDISENLLIIILVAFFFRNRTEEAALGIENFLVEY